MVNLFIAITMTYWFSLYVYMPIFTPYVESLGASLSMVGLIVGSYGFTQMMIRIPLGIYSDRIGKRKIFVITGLALALISSLGIGLVQTPWLVLIFRGLAGVAAAAWVSFTVMFSSFFKPEDASKAMGIIMFYTSLGQLIATTLGGFITDLWGYQAPFIVGSIIGVAGMLLGTRIREQSINRDPISVKQLVHVGKDISLLRISLLAILAQAINFSTIYGFNQSYAVGIGATEKQLSVLMVISALSIALGSLRSGVLAARFGEKRIIMVSFLLMLVASIAIPFINNMLLLYVSQAFNGFGRGLVFPVLMGMSIKTVSVDKRSTAMGFFQAIYGLGMFGGPVITGYVGDLYGLIAGYSTVGVYGLLGCILAVTIKTKKSLPVESISVR